ncbi:MAG: endonuclease MutS2, partial [Streptococcaceae bacterium]|nr:endonuclease MutS2 [Streptococcaceae bacterium]
MNNRIEKLLEFEKIREKLLQHTVTEKGRSMVQLAKVFVEAGDVQKALDETTDAMKVVRLRGGIPLSQMEDLTKHFKRLEIGANLNGLEFAQIYRMLKTTNELIRFFDDLHETEVEFLYLYEWSEKLVAIPEVSKRLRSSVDETGNILDEASAELGRLRRELKRAEATVRSTLGAIVRGKKAKYLSDTLITIRNDRYVLPVKTEYKNVFGGIVHDSSASGQTDFIEPREVVDLNNHMRQTKVAEKREVERILAELSQFVEPYANELKNNVYVLAKLDFFNAKAALAKELNAVVPIIDKENRLKIKAARHPLISSEAVVPNDIHLGEHHRTMVITGPNTGGKTIAMKTLGILQLMGQFGLAIPAGVDSQIGVFRKIFADIGDEQSIEQNLSTFSSHMTNIVNILSKMDDKTLILLDELGAGTDPQEGSALAIAILDKIASAGSTTLASTHYPELKAFGYNRKFATNASMEFDVESLKPTYKLLIGLPGRSNAFDISKRLGLSEEIISASRELIDEDSQDINEMIQDLESRRKMAEIEYFEARNKVDETEAIRKELEESKRKFEDEQERILLASKKEANQIIEAAKQESERIIREIREKQKQIGRVSVKEHELIQAKSDMNALLHEESLQKNRVLKRAKKQKPLKAGDEVLVESYGQRGTL